MRNFAMAAMVVAAGLVSGACSKTTTADPATANREDLNPPSGLTTTAAHTQLKATFVGQNVEEDFQGYEVFVMPIKIADPTVNGAVKYPSSLAHDLTKGAQIPRCADNSAVFTVFGMPAATSDCNGDTEAAAAASFAGVSVVGGAGLLDTSTGTSTDTSSGEDPAPTSFVACAENSANTKLSMPPATSATTQLGSLTCTIAKDSAGKALVDGTVYTIFVVAVAGTDFAKISWTSNWAQDTPVTPILDSPTFSIDSTGVFYSLPVANLADFTPVTGDLKVGGNCGDILNGNKSLICSVNQFNAVGTAPTGVPDGIYIGRQGTAVFTGGSAATYPERAFLSVPAGGTIKIAERGPQIDQSNLTLDPTKNIDLPDAHAVDATVDTTAYDALGHTYPIYGDQVFDIQVSSGGAVNYGKIVIGKVALADPTKADSNLTIPLAVIMDPGKDDTDY